MVDSATGKASLITDTPRGGKRVESLPSGLYHCTVTVNAENAFDPVAEFGFFFSENSNRRKVREPVLFELPGSMSRTPIWRIWLGF